jgi:hypothetical protein
MIATKAGIPMRPPIVAIHAGHPPRPRTCDAETDQPAKGQNGGEPGRLGHAHAEGLPAVRLDQHVGHAETRRAERDHGQQAQGPGIADEIAPASLEPGLSRGRYGTGAAARLLLPHRRDIERDGHDRRPLDDADQATGRVVFQQRAEDERADDHAEQERDIHQADDFRLIFLGHQIGGKGEARRLDHVDPGTDQQEGQRGGGVTDPQRGIGGFAVSRQDQQREGHDRESAELEQRAAPDERNTPQSQRGNMRIRAETDQHPEGREGDRQGQHDRNQGSGDRQFDDHHAVQRPRKQDERHAHRHLKQRQAQQAGKRHLLRCHIGKGQESCSHTRYPRERPLSVIGFQHGIIPCGAPHDGGGA